MAPPQDGKAAEVKEESVPQRPISDVVFIIGTPFFYICFEIFFVFVSMYLYANFFVCVCEWWIAMKKEASPLVEKFQLTEESNSLWAFFFYLSFISNLVQLRSDQKKKKTEKNEDWEKVKETDCLVQFVLVIFGKFKPTVVISGI